MSENNSFPCYSLRFRILRLFSFHLACKLEDMNKQQEYDTPAKISRLVNKCFKNTSQLSSGVLRASDLLGAPLKKRVAITEKYIPVVKEKYAAMFPRLCIEEEFASAMSQYQGSYDEEDRKEKLILAAAIWIIDKLRSIGRIEEAKKLFPKEILGWSIPDCLDLIEDSAIDQGLLSCMIYAIQMRNGKKDEKQGFLVDLSEGAKNEGGTRECFDAIIALIPESDKQAATNEFEAMEWDFLERYLRSCQFIIEKRDKYSEQLEEYKRICSSLEDTFRNSSFQKAGDLSTSKQLKDAYSSFNKLMNKLDDLEGLRYHLFEECTFLTLDWDHVLDSGSTQLGIRKLWEDRKAIDPYQMCFALLLLLDCNSDSAWLYNLGMAVISNASEALPWHERDGLVNISEDLMKSNCISEQGRLLDFGESDLYRRKFKDQNIPFSDGLYDSFSSLNLGQLFFMLTGLVLPRDEGNKDAVIKVLKDCGLSDETARMFYPSLLIAWNVQNPENMDEQIWEFYKEKHKDPTDLDSDGEQEAEPSENNNGTENKAGIQSRAEPELILLKTELSRLRSELHHEKCTVKALRDKASKAEETGYQDYEELVRLREIVHKNGLDRSDEENGETEQPIALPYTLKKSIVIIGGHDTWVNSMKPLLSGARFPNGYSNPGADMIRNADTIWIQNNALSHSIFDFVIDICRTEHKRVKYFSFNGAYSCAYEVARDDMETQ